MKVNTINLNTNYKMSFKGNDTTTTNPISNANNIVAPVPPIQGDSTQFKQALKVKKSFFENAYELLKSFSKQPKVDLAQWRPGMTDDEIASIRSSLY